MRRSIFLTALTLGALALTGCEQAMRSAAANLATTDALGIFSSEEVNMTQKNYAAADYLHQQSRSYISRHDTLKAARLVDEEENNVYAPIGRVITEEVGVRFSQLGFDVDLDDVTIKDPNYLQTRSSKSPDFILGGSYLRRPRTLDVSLRITEISTGRVVAVFNYKMPMNRDIAKLSEPEARIMQVGK